MDHAVRGVSVDFIESSCAEYQKHNQIDPAFYKRYRVKRGLRNADGIGVMTGATQTSNVMGYYIQDGERIPAPGELVYRGINMEELINGFVSEGRFGFGEAAYLFLFGVLPTWAQFTAFEGLLSAHRTLPPMFTEDMIPKAPSPDAMNKLARSVLAPYSHDGRPDDMSLPNQLRQAVELVARALMTVVHALTAKRHHYDNESLYLHRLQEGLSVAQNFLYSVRHDNRYIDKEIRLLDLCLTPHAERGGGNNFVFACRVFFSSGTDIYSSIAAAVGSLKGPRHGDVSKKVTEMFGHIEAKVSGWTDDDMVRDYLGRLLRKEAGDRLGLIYGMGHAIYTLSDPQAVPLKRFVRSLAEIKGMLDEFEPFERVERLTPETLHTTKRGEKVVYANVDLFSGLVYEMMGIPMELYILLFAVAQMVGWCAHRIEEVCQSVNRITRPAYKVVAPMRAFVPLDQRWAMSQVTKRALEASPKKLLLERPLDKITVTDIAEDCDINHTAFYYYFQDIYDLVEWARQENARRILSGKYTYTTWQERSRRILDGLIDNRPFTPNVYRSVRQEQVETFLSQVTHGLLTGVVEELDPRGEVQEEDKAFLASFYKYAFVGLVLDWTHTDMKGEPAELVHRVELVASGSFAQALEHLRVDSAHQAGPFDRN